MAVLCAKIDRLSMARHIKLPNSITFLRTSAWVPTCASWRQSQPLFRSPRYLCALAPPSGSHVACSFDPAVRPNSRLPQSSCDSRRAHVVCRQGVSVDILRALPVELPDLMIRVGLEPTSSALLAITYVSSVCNGEDGHRTRDPRPARAQSSPSGLPMSSWTSYSRRRCKRSTN